jgi:hypothetical protein
MTDRVQDIMALVEQYAKSFSDGQSPVYSLCVVIESRLRELVAPPVPEPDCSGGMPCTTCPDKKACQRGCRRQPEFLSHEYHDRKDLRAECDAVDTLLRVLGLDPDRCRTEGGALNASRALSLLLDILPRLKAGDSRSSSSVAEHASAGFNRKKNIK